MRTKVIECKAPQHEFLATYVDVEPEKNVHHAQRQKEHKKEGSLDHVFCPLSRVMSIDLQNMVALEMSFSRRFQKVYTYPPLMDDMFPHRSETRKKAPNKANLLRRSPRVSIQKVGTKRKVVTAVMDRMFDRVLAGRLLGRDVAGLRSRVTLTK